MDDCGMEVDRKVAPVSSSAAPAPAHPPAPLDIPAGCSELIKAVLPDGLEGGRELPQRLINDLCSLLEERKNDYLFKIIPQPGQGYGKIQCLEPACLAKKKVIDLNEAEDVADGGKECGIGSLNYFFHHQKESPAHTRGRLARLKKEKEKEKEKESVASSSAPSSAPRASKSKDVKPSPGRLAAPSKPSTKTPKQIIEIGSDDDDAELIQRTSRPESRPSTGMDLDDADEIAYRPLLKRDNKGKPRAPLQPTTSNSSIDGNKKPNATNAGSTIRDLPVNRADGSRISLRDVMMNDEDSDVEPLPKRQRSDSVLSNGSDEDLMELPTNFRAAPSDKYKKVLDRAKATVDAKKENIPSSSTSQLPYEKALPAGFISGATTAKPASAVPSRFDTFRGQPASSSSSPAAGKTGAFDDSGFSSGGLDTSSSSPAKRAFGSNTSQFNTDDSAADRLERWKSLFQTKVEPATAPQQATATAWGAHSRSNTAPGSTGSQASASFAGLARSNSATKAPLSRSSTLSSHGVTPAAGKSASTTTASGVPLEFESTEVRITEFIAKQYRRIEQANKKMVRGGDNRIAANKANRAETNKRYTAIANAKEHLTDLKRPVVHVPGQPPSENALLKHKRAISRFYSFLDMYRKSEEEKLKTVQALEKVLAASGKAISIELQRRDWADGAAMSCALRAIAPGQRIQRTRDLNNARLALAEAKQAKRNHLATIPRYSAVLAASVPKPSSSSAAPAARPTHSMPGMPAASQPAAAWPQRGTPSDYSYTGLNPYGDDEERMGFLLGNKKVDFGWGAPAASTSKYAANTANLGPIGLAGRTGMGMPGKLNVASDDDDEKPDWNRSMAGNVGIDEEYNYNPNFSEEKIQSYFADAAGGYDFNEEGELALENALVTIGLSKQGDKFENSAIVPYAHQILGISWMLNQEKVSKYKGGVLADEMGLGKTVQTISLIMLNRAKRDDDEKSTLVLAPLALLQQWKNEIEQYSEGNLTAWIYHGPGKNIKKKELKKYDVVITTVHTMMGEWQECDDVAMKRVRREHNKKHPNSRWTEENEEDWYDKVREQKSTLFTMHWRRVVIDEAQNIRNRTTKASRAVCYLSAQYRWCLTGTPVTNTLSDFYALMRFIRVKPWHEWSEWSDKIVRVEKRRPDLASTRVQQINKLVLLRRNKDSTFGGKRLLNLPTKHNNNYAVVLSEEEMEIYDYIEGKSQEVLNRYIKEGSVARRNTHIFAMLLRLRQCVGHPALVQELSMEAAYTSAEEKEAERKKALAAAAARIGQEQVDAVLKRRFDFTKQRMEDEKAGQDISLEECPICYETLDASAKITPCGHCFCPCITEWMERAETAIGNPEGFGDDDRGCPNCRQKITKDTIFMMKDFEPTQTQIAELTGEQAMQVEENFNRDVAEFLETRNSNLLGSPDKKAIKGKGKGRASSNSDSRSSTNSLKPRAANSRAAKRRVIKDSEDEDEDDFIDDSECARPVKGYTKKTGAESDSEAEIDEIEDDDDETEDEDQGVDESEVENLKPAKSRNKASKSGGIDVRELFKGKQFIPSSKFLAMAKIIREAPAEDKFMIISQWTTMLDLVSAYLCELDISHIQFRGDMKRQDRDLAVKKFNTHPTTKCLLMSLKAGGVGLNLTGGNRAILLDLAWSPAVEAQCFDRLHRLGQKKEVYVDRCIVANTVEDRILLLQDHKQKLADNSLGEGSGQKLKKMGIAELKMLFGMSGEAGGLAAGWKLPDDQPRAIRRPPVAGPSNRAAGGKEVPAMI